jgi:hypothetical protein
MDILARYCAVAKRMIVYHRPPKAHMPGQPGNAGWAKIVAFMFWPIGAPSFIGRLPDVQTLSCRSPQAFLSGKAIEMIAGEFPGHLELSHQAAMRFVI